MLLFHPGKHLKIWLNRYETHIFLRNSECSYNWFASMNKMLQFTYFPPNIHKQWWLDIKSVCMYTNTSTIFTWDFLRFWNSSHLWNYNYINFPKYTSEISLKQHWKTLLVFWTNDKYFASWNGNTGVNPGYQSIHHAFSKQKLCCFWEQREFISLLTDISMEKAISCIDLLSF